MDFHLFKRQAFTNYKEPVCIVIRLSAEHCWCASGVIDKYEEFEIDLDD